jgi:hypothetical protein
MGKSLFRGFYRTFIYERNEMEIVTFQKIGTKDIGLSMLHSSEGGRKDQNDY